MNVRESQIEDVLATHPEIARKILDASDELTLIARQKILPSGSRIDLLFVAGQRLILVELKVERCRRIFLEQTARYATELRGMQAAGKLVAGALSPFLVCTESSPKDREQAERCGLTIANYDAETVLSEFFARLQANASFMSLKPTNHGLWNLHLLHKILYALDAPKRTQDLAVLNELSSSSIRSYLSLASELLLVSETKGVWSLTENGRKYVWNREPDTLPEFVSEEQSAVLQNVIIENPFASGVILGIYTLVESLYNLSRNTYPVHAEHLMEYFRYSSGRFFQWTARKTAADSMRMYSNYAIDIGLAGRIGDKYYLTPAGIRFILMLNLHKTLKMVDSLGITRQQ